jgi:hypothetical protein
MLKITSMDQVYSSCTREYMSGVDRNNRNYKTQEVFTPDWMVDYTLKEIPEYLDLDSVCLDRAAGDGQFLSKILINKMIHYQSKGMEIHESFINSLDSIFGVDIERENVDLCRQRLLCGCSDKEIIALVERRIILGDCLNPNQKLAEQTDQDHLLMKRYFGLSITIDSEAD